MTDAGESDRVRPVASSAAGYAPATETSDRSSAGGHALRFSDVGAGDTTHNAAGDVVAMIAGPARAGAAVAIRDRRELPFFQVRLPAVQAIRDGTSGPRRLRAIGFYTVLCQLANEQRHAGGHRLVRVSYDGLAHRGQMSKRTAKVLLDALEAAGVVRYERHADRATGGVVSLLHLLIHDDPWTAITVAMADHLALPRPGGHLLRDLGMIVVLLEFCGEQRQQHGGLAAEVMRGDIARRAGVTVDRVDHGHRALERAGVLEVERRRTANGGRHLPSVYTVREAPQLAEQIGVSVPAAQRNGTGSAADEYQQGHGSVPTAPQNGTGSAVERFGQGRGSVPAAPRIGSGSAAERYRGVENSATSVTVTRPSIARARRPAVEEDVENIPPSSSSVETGVWRRGGGDPSGSPEDLCEVLLKAWRPVLGDSPVEHFRGHHAGWLNAAAAVLRRHPRDRLDAALAYMVGDEILGSQAITMPGFARIADQLIARAHARRLRGRSPARPGVGDGASLRWEDARRELERAIRRHGRDSRREAVDDLAAESALLVRFVERVGWTSLCEQPFRYAERRYAELWRELADHPSDQPQEPAA